MSIQMGIKYSKAKIYWYKHNDMDSLENTIRSVFSKLCNNKKKFKTTRCFIVTEAIFYNYGDIIDLKRLIEIKKKYKIRLLIDETLSFGLLGNTGRGISEYYDVDIKDIDLISSTLEASIGTVGGFCSGSNYIIERQRLSSLGYIFSASQPPVYAHIGICVPINYVLHGAPPSCVYHIRLINPSLNRDDDVELFEKVEKKVF